MILMGLGQESDREGELASWEAASSRMAGVRVHTRCTSAKKRCLRLLLKTVGEKAYIL